MVEYGKVQEPYWDDAPVFLIGGGSSLKGFDFTKLVGKGTIVGINSAAFITPSHCCFSLDRTWSNGNVERLRNFKGEKYIALATLGMDENHYEPNTIYLLRERLPRLSKDPQRINGQNSGFGAINLAYLKKAKEVYLLGYDMNTERGTPHWHNEYPYKIPRRNFYQRWAEEIHEIAPTLEAAGVKVFNCNPDSAIKCFEVRPYETLQ